VDSEESESVSEGPWCNKSVEEFKEEEQEEEASAVAVRLVAAAANDT